MKKIILFLPFILLLGCEKEYDSVVESVTPNYQVRSVSSFANYTYIPGDSSATFYVEFNNAGYISSVYLDVYSSDGSRFNGSSVEMYDDGKAEHGDAAAGDKVYSNTFPFSFTYPNGKYTVEYFVTETTGSTKKVAVQNFVYNNAQSNISPVVSNLSAPDTIALGTETQFIHVTMAAADSNGINDIEQVFFNSFLPNGNASSQNPFIMYDDGNINDHGDETAGDGIYSIIVQLPATGVTLGTYRWEFQARDRGKKLSNKIIHNVVIE